MAFEIKPKRMEDGITEGSMIINATMDNVYFNGQAYDLLTLVPRPMDFTSFRFNKFNQSCDMYLQKGISDKGIKIAGTGIDESNYMLYGAGDYLSNRCSSLLNNFESVNCIRDINDPNICYMISRSIINALFMKVNSKTGEILLYHGIKEYNTVLEKNRNPHTVEVTKPSGVLDETMCAWSLLDASIIHQNDDYILLDAVFGNDGYYNTIYMYAYLCCFDKRTGNMIVAQTSNSYASIDIYARKIIIKIENNSVYFLSYTFPSNGWRTYVEKMNFSNGNCKQLFQENRVKQGGIVFYSQSTINKNIIYMIEDANDTDATMVCKKFDFTDILNENYTEEEIPVESENGNPIFGTSSKSYFFSRNSLRTLSWTVVDDDNKEYIHGVVLGIHDNMSGFETNYNNGLYKWYVYEINNDSIKLIHNYNYMQNASLCTGIIPYTEDYRTIIISYWNGYEIRTFDSENKKYEIAFYNYKRNVRSIQLDVTNRLWVMFDDGTIEINNIASSITLSCKFEKNKYNKYNASNSLTSYVTYYAKNISGEYVEMPVKLSLNGNAVFQENNKSEIEVTTSDIGPKIEYIKITGKGYIETNITEA